jgi:gliding motility-associated-like protein
MRIKSIFFTLVHLLPLIAVSQSAFFCNNSSYLIVDQSSSSSTLYRLEIDNVTETVNFSPVISTNGYNVNAIGFRSTDNLIYGIDYTNGDLYRFYADGNIEYLTSLDLPQNFIYPSGDVSPDGKSLILLGHSTSSDSISISVIELETGNYDIVNYNLFSATGNPVFCTDIAFHPYTQELFSFDAVSHRLVSIDIANQLIDNASFPIQTNVNNIPALFFDAFGNLFGLGDSPSSTGNLYIVDTESGMARFFSGTPNLDGNRDGCSCPYTVVLEQEFLKETTFPCTENSLTIRIANLSGMTQTGINLIEIFEEEITIQEIFYNPYDGDIGSTIGSNELNIAEMIIPPGIDSIVLQLDVGQITPGVYHNQAMVLGVDLSLSMDISILSDNPNTIAKNDSSVIEILPLFVDLDNNQSIICSDTEVLLSTDEQNGLSYLWNNGATTPSITVTEPGLYSITVSTACEFVIDSIELSLATLTLDLGEDIAIDIGSLVVLEPFIYSLSTDIAFQWYKGYSSVCMDCSAYQDMPLNSTQYLLTIEDEYGCTARDSIYVSVLKDYNIFSPNVFSPNSDGRNDTFYLQSKRNQKITSFSVFDRWGGVVFQNKNTMTNISSEGWDGRFRGDVLDEGVYLWTATIKFFDGTTRKYSGDILILK